MDGRKNNKGSKGNKGGNKGYGATILLKENVDKFSPLFWEQMNKMIKSNDPSERRFAMTEFNKIQCKLIPTTLANDKDNPLPTPILAHVQLHDIYKQGSEPN